MNRLLLAGLVLICAGLLSACGRSAITPRAHTATLVPELNVTRPPATARPTLMAAEAQPSPSPVPPTATPTSTSTSVPTLTPSPVVTRVRPTPTSSGPLSVAVYVASCRRAPAPGKSGNVIVQIAIEATGGNGEFHYFNEGVESPTKFVDIAWERGTRLIGSVRVLTGDGQSLKKDYDIPTGALTCQ